MSIVSDCRAPVDDRAEGVRRRDAAHDLQHVHRDCLIRRGQRVLLLTLLDRGTATADDVRAGIDLPDGIDPVCLGAVPTALARAGIIRRAGYVETTRPVAHARPVSVWVIADHAAAVAWLDSYPDLPTPERVAARDAAQQCLISWEAAP